MAALQTLLYLVTFQSAPPLSQAERYLERRSLDVYDYFEMFYKPKRKHARNVMNRLSNPRNSKSGSNKVPRQLGAILFFKIRVKRKKRLGALFISTGTRPAPMQPIPLRGVRPHLRA